MGTGVRGIADGELDTEGGEAPRWMGRIVRGAIILMDHPEMYKKKTTRA